MVHKITSAFFSRASVAIILSIFFLRLPQLMPTAWKWMVVAMILVFFLFIPDLKGYAGGLVAGIFSLIFAGLGQFYVRQYLRGFLFSFGAVFTYMIREYSPRSIVFNIVLFIIAAIDAFSFGKRGIGIL